jgi:CRP-like cAMP-binding protein
MINTDKIDFKDLIAKYPDLWIKKKMEKNEILIKKGEMEKRIFYVKSGILRAYSYNKEVNKEATVAFISDDEVIVSYNCFVKNLPAVMDI